MRKKIQKIIRFLLLSVLFWGMNFMYLDVTAAALASGQSITGETDTQTVLPQKPMAVSNFSATAYSYRKIKLQWSEVAEVDAYRIYRSKKKYSGYVFCARVEQKTTSFIDSSIETGKTYYYKIRTVKNAVKSASVRVSCMTKPKKVYGGKAEITSENKVRLTWNAVPRAQQYQIYRSKKKTSGFKKIKTLTKNNFVNSSVTKGTTYYYRVRALCNGTAGKFSKTFSITVPAEKKVVIVLDPGHGGWDSGACYYGYKEEDLNLEIATYAKQELETYKNVEVYLTRSSDWTFCNENKAKDFKMRADFAKSKNADAFISIHLNASENTSANGAEIYASVNQKFYAQGELLGGMILNELSAIGIARREIVHRMSGTTPGQDYYGIIRNGVANDMLSMIIEHCFLSSPMDVKKVLSTKEGRKKLGQADARAIASYYKLSK